MPYKISLFLAALLHITCLQAQVSKEVSRLAYTDSVRLVEIFKDIHQNPELAFMEVHTSEIVAKELTTLGYKVHTRIGKTGVVGVLENGKGPTVMYRADMDCNAVKETTGLPYASNKTMTHASGAEVPVMHACGHDAHITWLLGVSRILVELKKEWKGTLVVVAQPAEEIGEGAKAMVSDKMYDKGIPVPDFLFGMHTRPIAVGKIENAPGDRMAGTDQINVTFLGVGGHGASPEFTKDPIIMACNAVMQYQTIISRNIGAQDVAVLTVGAFQSGTANNVIPSSAVLKLNLRWFDEKTRNTLIDGIKRINEGIAVANNLPQDLYPKFEIKSTAYPLVNNKEMTEKINLSLIPVIGKENIVTDIPPLMISEDFHYLALANKKTVYDYLFVGIANQHTVQQANKEGKQYPFYNHNSNYEVDLSAIPLGVELGATALLEMFRK